MHSTDPTLSAELVDLRERLRRVQLVLSALERQHATKPAILDALADV